MEYRVVLNKYTTNEMQQMVRPWKTEPFIRKNGFGHLIDNYWRYLLQKSGTKLFYLKPERLVTLNSTPRKKVKEETPNFLLCQRGLLVQLIHEQSGWVSSIFNIHPIYYIIYRISCLLFSRYDNDLKLYCF